MTEQEWAVCAEPVRMLGWITCAGPSGSGTADLERWRNRPSDRKLRLWAVAVGRLMQIPAHHLFDAVEDWADGGEKPSSIEYPPWSFEDDDIGHAVCVMACASWGTRYCKENRQRDKAALLREVVGNLYRPLCPAVTIGEMSTWMLWHDCTIPRLAESIYQSRTWEELPILADALEEAGCTDIAILAHCRGEEVCANCGGAGRIWVDYPPVEPHWNGCIDCHCTGYALLDPTPWEHREHVSNDVASLEVEMHARLYPVQHCRGCWVLDLLTGRQ